MSKYLDKIIKIKTKESLMNRLESLRIKNYKHIGDSYIGFDKLENLNILVGQNNIGKSTLLQSIEMLISEDVTNRELSTDTMLEFGFCPTETEIKNVFREDTSGGEIGINHFTFGAKYINEYISFEYQPIKAIGKEQITLSNIPGIPQTQITSYKRIDNFNYLANNYLNNNIRRLKLIKLSKLAAFTSFNNGTMLCLILFLV